jgi:hypothetical protein
LADKPPYDFTTEVLKGLLGETVILSNSDKPVWIKENNWKWTINPDGSRSLDKDSDGLYILKEGVREGHR